MENKVKYTHFTPNKNEKAICSDLLNIINDLAPSNSFVAALVDQSMDGTYKASISVDAVCGNFHVESSDNSLISSFKKAQKDLIKNLSEWKTHRFILS